MQATQEYLHQQPQRKPPHILLISAALVAFIGLTLFALKITDPALPDMTIQPLDGYEVQWLSQPRDLTTTINDLQRTLYAGNCRYTLHGWSADNKLYYGSNCIRDLWEYNSINGNGVRRIEALPANFEPATQITRWDRSRSSTGPSKPRGTQGFVITFEKSTSPDGTVEAAVTQDFFYDPLDVIVLRQTDE